MANPVITHIRIVANNDVIRDFDAQFIAEYMLKTRGSIADGFSLDIPMTDIQYSLKRRILNTLFPSYAYTQVKMYLTIAPLASVTSGSPTGTSGAQILLNEITLPRSNISYKLYDMRMLQISAPLSMIGNNDLTNFLSTDGYYKSVLYFASTSGTAPYASPSDTLINYLQLILNLRNVLKDKYWVSLKQENQSLFGTSMDAGYGMEIFMQDNDFAQLLALNDPVKQKSVNLKLNTTATGYLYALKNEYIDH